MMYFCVGLVLLSGISMNIQGIMASTGKVTGLLGGTVGIPCSHMAADRNLKYFCRKPCSSDKDILIKSGQSSTGKYKMEDYGNGIVTVTITGLQKSDSGTYWCGVDRFLMDTYTKVVLTVTEALSTTAPSAHKPAPATALLQTVTSPEPSTSRKTTISPSTSRKTTISPSTSETSFTTDLLPSVPLTSGTLRYTAAGLVAMLILIGMSMITLYICRRTRSGSQITASPVYSVIEDRRSNHLNNQQNRAASSTTGAHEETMENPVYCSAGLQDERTDSHIYFLAQQPAQY